PLFELALELEDAVLQDEYCQEWGLQPTVNLYSGFIYRAMGLPQSMYPVMFALGRLPGWLAHFRELKDDAHYPLVRPRQIYVGATRRPEGNRPKRSEGPKHGIDSIWSGDQRIARH